MTEQDLEYSCVSSKPDSNPWLALMGGVEVHKGHLWWGWFLSHPELEVLVKEMGPCRSDDQAVWELRLVVTLFLPFG